MYWTSFDPAPSFDAPWQQRATAWPASLCRPWFSAAFACPPSQALIETCDTLGTEIKGSPKTPAASACLHRKARNGRWLVSARRCRREGKSRGHIYQAGQRVGPHLLHHSPSVRLHCDLGNAELATDLLVQPAGNDRLKYRLGGQ